MQSGAELHRPAGTDWLLSRPPRGSCCVPLWAYPPSAFAVIIMSRNPTVFKNTRQPVTGDTHFQHFPAEFPRFAVCEPLAVPQATLSGFGCPRHPHGYGAARSVPHRSCACDLMSMTSAAIMPSSTMNWLPAAASSPPTPHQKTSVPATMHAAKRFNFDFSIICIKFAV